jgi:hypothetical protein
MARPVRIQRARTKGWRMPTNAVFVGRPGRWGNPWAVATLRAALLERVDWLADDKSRSPLAAFFVARFMRDGAAPIRPTTLARCAAIELFHDLALAFRAAEPARFEAWIAPLRGRDLACWCATGERCHADVLLELANG